MKLRRDLYLESTNLSVINVEWRPEPIAFPWLPSNQILNITREIADRGEDTVTASLFNSSVPADRPFCLEILVAHCVGGLPVEIVDGRGAEPAPEGTLQGGAVCCFPACADFRTYLCIEIEIVVKT